MAGPAPPRAARDAERDAVFEAGQWRLMWRTFRKHRVATVCAAVVACFYFVALFADFFSSVDPTVSDELVTYLPPQSIQWLDGGSLRPYVEGITSRRDPATFKKHYAADPEVKLPLRFFGRGYEYRLLGLIPSDRHLLIVEGDRRTAPYLLGTDNLGRDVLARILRGSRVSLTIGLVGVAISFVLGVMLGGISGYYGGPIDTLIQRLIEVLNSIPSLPLWIALASAMPRDWSLTQRYFAITAIIALTGWTHLARVVRGRLLSMREEDFIVAARLTGARDGSIIARHMVPNFASHLIAVVTLAIPGMIIGETSLSFLGLGLRPPAISWGVLLQAAQNVQSVALYPWLMVAAAPVIVAVLVFNFVGDGLRDAADPYSR